MNSASLSARTSANRFALDRSAQELDDYDVPPLRLHETLTAVAETAGVTHEIGRWQGTHIPADPAGNLLG
jgi:hypothetical protein